MKLICFPKYYINGMEVVKQPLATIRYKWLLVMNSGMSFRYWLTQRTKVAKSVQKHQDKRQGV
jgi:hypothetical protein